ncbi:MAG TPA: DUF3426 domain-containing protein, partial [Gammaproteobacteria bacterium]|nr:DUF3426 domain-containing protein [Gammaproteobacteria bacterium]
MYTDCPNCHTYFKITPEQLKAADGKVRCGSCHHVFNALPNLVEKIPSRASRAKTSKKPELAETAVGASTDVASVAADTTSLNPVRPTSENTVSIDLAGNASEADAFLLDDAGEPEEKASLAAEKKHGVLDDINKDIDEALDKLFDDEPQFENASQESMGAGANRKHEQASKNDGAEEHHKNKEKTAVSEFDLSDGFDDLLFEHADEPGDSILEALSENDDFTSSEPIQRHAVEWETLSRTARPVSSDKTSRLKSMTSKLQAGLNFSRAAWIGIISLLVVTLLGQFAYSKHEELVKYAPLKAVLEQACAVIGIVTRCEVPGPRDVDAIAVLERNVIAHPNAENALLITATISNEADFNQKYPDLVL